MEGRRGRGGARPGFEGFFDPYQRPPLYRHCPPFLFPPYHQVPDYYRPPFPGAGLPLPRHRPPFPRHRPPFPQSSSAAQNSAKGPLPKNAPKASLTSHSQESRPSSSDSQSASATLENAQENNPQLEPEIKLRKEEDDQLEQLRVGRNDAGKALTALKKDFQKYRKKLKSIGVQFMKGGDIQSGGIPGGPQEAQKIKEEFEKRKLQLGERIRAFQNGKEAWKNLRHAVDDRRAASSLKDSFPPEPPPPVIKSFDEMNRYQKHAFKRNRFKERRKERKMLKKKEKLDAQNGVGNIGKEREGEEEELEEEEEDEEEEDDEGGIDNDNFVEEDDDMVKIAATARNSASTSSPDVELIEPVSISPQESDAQFASCSNLAQESHSLNIEQGASTIQLDLEREEILRKEEEDELERLRVARNDAGKSLTLLKKNFQKYKKELKSIGVQFLTGVDIRCGGVQGGPQEVKRIQDEFAERKREVGEAMRAFENGKEGWKNLRHAVDDRRAASRLKDHFPPEPPPPVIKERKFEEMNIFEKRALKRKQFKERRKEMKMLKKKGQFGAQSSVGYEGEEEEDKDNGNFDEDDDIDGVGVDYQ